jgi:flagellar hook-associated protein 3 FlgL
MTQFRIATANSFDATINRINQRTVELVNSQEKLSAGKRVLRASDDPVAATLAERESNRLMRTEADLRALERSRSSLQQAESTLGQMGDVLTRFKELLVQGGNASLSASDRRSVALEMRGLRDQLLNLANTQDTEGNALFGGLGTTSSSGRPFAEIFGLGAPPGNAQVAFQGLAGQTAPTEIGLPNRVDGDFALMRNLSGDGVVSIEFNTGNVLVTDASVTETPQNLNVFPFDATASTQGRYELSVSSVAGPPETLQLSVVRFNRDSATPALPPIPAIVLGPAGPDGTINLSNQTFTFEGVQVTLSGQAAAGASFTLQPSQPVNLFTSLQRAITALEDPNLNSTGRTQALGQVHQEMQSGQDRLLLVRGRLGELLRRAESIEGLLQDRSVAGQRELSSLTDLDMVKGISEFQTQQLGLQAALQSYAQVQRLSLFQFIA